MHFNHPKTLFLLSLVPQLTKANELLTALFQDMVENSNEYYSYILTAKTSDYGVLLDLEQDGFLTKDYYEEMPDMLTKSSKYTSGFSSFATHLPWYSSRILPLLKDADADSGSDGDAVSGSRSSKPFNVTSDMIVNPNVSVNDAMARFGFDSNVLRGLSVGVPAVAVGLILL
ncbi:unnamed protein product [Ambrosiozyma monospora]|uniref:Unnamed protein product n=1 Tax=Ambrosiozyma monospora TaxID=43982 RepID=A0ACB5T197_AMBMO|nr:unnamed protein product [Ambrosiozyma monospora]